VGTPTGPRSNVWKFIAANDNSIYVISRLFGSDSKISLHPSGECQFSGTSAWVLKDSTRRNRDRHFFKWSEKRPLGGPALDALQIRVPHSELIPIDVPEDLSDVHWVSAPAPGNLAGLECYITPPSPLDPTVGATLPFTQLASIQLPDSSWLVIGHFEEECDQRLVESFRTTVQQHLANEGREWAPQQRACVTIEGHATCKAFMELSSRAHESNKNSAHPSEPSAKKAMSCQWSDSAPCPFSPLNDVFVEYEGREYCPLHLPLASNQKENATNFAGRFIGLQEAGVTEFIGVIFPGAIDPNYARYDARRNLNLTHCTFGDRVQLVGNSYNMNLSDSTMTGSCNLIVGSGDAEAICERVTFIGSLIVDVSDQPSTLTLNGSE